MRGTLRMNEIEKCGSNIMKKRCKFIMKVLGVSLLCVFICGCGTSMRKGDEKKAKIAENIEWLTVNYFENEETSVRVTIDFSEKQKEKVVIKNGKEKETSSYDRCEELTEFVKDRVIAETEKETASTNSNCDDQEILWRIHIVSGNESWNLDSLSWDGEEDYPKY